MKNASSAAIGACLLSLAGCAHAPLIETASTGQWPIAGKSSFGFGTLDMGGDTALRARIATCLSDKGMTASSTPAYLVQLGLSEPPAGSNVIHGDNVDMPPEHASAKRRNELLAVSISSIVDGHEVYRVQATGHYRRPTNRQSASTLADAACQAIGAPPAATRGS